MFDGGNAFVVVRISSLIRLLGRHGRHHVLIFSRRHRRGLILDRGRRRRRIRPGRLVEPPHVTAERVLVPKHLAAELAVYEGRPGLVHVPDVPRQRVPGKLLVAVGTRLLRLVCIASRGA